MNEIIRNLTIENFLNLKSSYENSRKIFWDDERKKLIHPGEYGTYRERLIKNWLRIYVPERFGISSGFIINAENKISTQCDIVIYDKFRTPQIQSTNEQLFFPAETVVVAGEIKSDINSTQQLNQYLEKLSEIKKLREGIKYPTPYYRESPNKYDPALYSSDNIFTFLICNKLNFAVTENSIKNNIELKYKHNAVLSLNDGLIGYYHKKNSPQVTVPFIGGGIEMRQTFMPDDGKDLPNFLGIFICGLQNALILTTLLEIDLADYLSDDVYG